MYRVAVSYSIGSGVGHSYCLDLVWDVGRIQCEPHGGTICMYMVLWGFLSFPLRRKRAYLRRLKDDSKRVNVSGCGHVPMGYGDLGKYCMLCAEPWDSSVQWRVPGHGHWPGPGGLHERLLSHLPDRCKLPVW